MSRKSATPKLHRKGKGQILIRNIDAAMKRKLRRRAERHGHSMEQEVRDILQNALKDESHREKGLGTRIAERFRGVGLKEDIPELRGYRIDPPNFDE
jgi:plasmid stability protein